MNAARVADIVHETVEGCLAGNEDRVTPKLDDDRRVVHREVIVPLNAATSAAAPARVSPGSAAPAAQGSEQEAARVAPVAAPEPAEWSLAVPE